MNPIVNEIVKRISKVKSVALFCHTNPDGDTISSALALQHAIKLKGIEAFVFCDTVIPKHFDCLEGAMDISLPVKRNFDLGIAVDCSDLDRLGNCIKSYLSTKSQIAIDHHASHKKFADITFLDAEAAATAEIMIEVIKGLKGLDDLSAKLLYAGMVTDSGCFSFSNTTQNTMKVASELRTYNFDSADLIYNVYRKCNVNKFKLKNRVLNNCKFYNDNRIGIITFRKEDFEETNTTDSDTEGIISNVIDIESVEIAFAVAEVKDKNFKVSIRTKANVDAADCANVFGGGGHKAAAGCRVCGFYEDVIERLLKVANDRL